MERSAAAAALPVSDTADREVVMTRRYDAPPDLVWRAWTEPAHVVQWWGPNGFTTTIEEMEVRPGGVWRFVMHGPDGTDFPNKVVFTEVVRPERLAYLHSDGTEDGIRFDVTVIFEAVGDDATQLTMTSVFPTAEMLRDTEAKYQAVEGARQHVQRLAEYLVSMERAR